MAKKDNVVEETNVNVNEEVAPTVAPETVKAEPTVHVSPDVAPETEIPDTTENINTPKVSDKPKRVSKADAEFNRLVEETINGVHGSGRERMLSLGENYTKVQQELTRRYREQSK